MSSFASKPPLRLEYRPSSHLILILLGVHGTALAMLPPLSLDTMMKWPVAAAIIWQLIVTWRRHVTLAAPRAVRRLVWEGDGKWVLCSTNGENHEAKLLPLSYVHSWLVVLRFVTDDKRYCTVILPPDALDPDSHRRLRARLRLSGVDRD